MLGPRTFARRWCTTAALWMSCYPTPASSARTRRTARHGPRWRRRSAAPANAANNPWVPPGTNGRSPGLQSRGFLVLSPDLLCRLDQQFELAALVVPGQVVAVIDRREATLRCQGEVLDCHVLRRFLDTAHEVVLRL